VNRTVLIVDADSSISESLAELVRFEGYVALTADSGEQALTLCRAEPVSFLLADHKLPDLSGIETMKRARAEAPDLVAIVMVGFGAIDVGAAALKDGAFAYIMKPFDADELLCVLKRGGEHLDARALIKKLEAELECARAIDSSGRFLAFDRAGSHALVRAVAGVEKFFSRDHAATSDAIAKIAERIAKALDVADDEVEQVVCAARLHRISVYISAEEGERLTRVFPSLARAADFIRAQEERWDGSGGPDGLAHEAIPLGARILAVAKGYADGGERDAEVAIAELKRGAGTAFDPMVVAVLDIETAARR
jgi:response regulator RpfG family c-di-GMP phosphodiesterase